MKKFMEKIGTSGTSVVLPYKEYEIDLVESTLLTNFYRKHQNNFQKTTNYSKVLYH